jgi:hypothetical protein
VYVGDIFVFLGRDGIIKKSRTFMKDGATRNIGGTVENVECCLKAGVS